ncbi:hypothetical protein [Candidatus Methylacidithermus pantelleriae]|uniref:hypothetical protein n=1 Tax=Candidatus Methylacidithermus pantelleriae TaxID=2744239 RepID=UPI001BD46BC8|nr:hypothetical protein [Candidatus Methylacidithermus pantelleriae]
MSQALPEKIRARTVPKKGGRSDRMRKLPLSTYQVWLRMTIQEGSFFSPYATALRTGKRSFPCQMQACASIKPEQSVLPAAVCLCRPKVP